MQIHREAVHAYDFDRLCADEARHRFAQLLMIGIPRRAGGMMSIDTKLFPVVQLLVDNLPRRFGHQPKRIASEINYWLAIIAERQMKFFAQMAKRILGIELLCELFVGRKSHCSKISSKRSTFNAQRPTLNSDVSNSQHSTIGCLELAAA